MLLSEGGAESSAIGISTGQTNLACGALLRGGFVFLQRASVPGDDWVRAGFVVGAERFELQSVQSRLRTERGGVVRSG
jgi:hypothetical protein